MINNAGLQVAIWIEIYFVPIFKYQDSSEADAEPVQDGVDGLDTHLLVNQNIFLEL